MKVHHIELDLRSTGANWSNNIIISEVSGNCIFFKLDRGVGRLKNKETRKIEKSQLGKINIHHCAGVRYIASAICKPCQVDGVKKVIMGMGEQKIATIINEANKMQKELTEKR